MGVDVKSQNGWKVHESSTGLEPLPWVTGRVHPETWALFDWFCRRFDAEVEKIVRSHSWGWAYRPIRGKSDGFSNHASGTAIDLNAPAHPLGKRGTFTEAQADTIRAIIAETDGALRWGGDYRNRADEMHIEIDTDMAGVKTVTRRLLAETEEDTLSWSQKLAGYDPDETNPTEMSAGDMLRSARGFAFAGWRRLKNVQQRLKDVQTQLDRIEKKLEALDDDE